MGSLPDEETKAIVIECNYPQNGMQNVNLNAGVHTPRPGSS